jgi:hypothetical protein
MLELDGFVGSVGSSRLTMSINFCKYTMFCSYLQFMSSASVQTTFGPKYFLSIHYHPETTPFRFVFQVRVRRNHVATINTMTHRTTKTTHRFHGNEVATVLATLAQEHTICCITFYDGKKSCLKRCFLPVLVVVVYSLSLVSLVSKAHDGEMNESMKKGTNWSQKGRTKGRQG